MALLEINWKPDSKLLRSFGLFGLGVLALLGALIWWRESFFGIRMQPGTAHIVAIVMFCAAGLFGLLALTAPKALLYPYVGLTAISLPIGWVVSHLIMGLLFYGVITPIGLVFRLMGRDAMDRKFEAQRESYWIPREQVTDPKRYFRQF